MYLAEMIMQEELAQLNGEMEKGNEHLNDLRSTKYDFYNESAITCLQNKILQIKSDLKELLLDGYLTNLQEIAKTTHMAEKEMLYNDVRIGLDRELTSFRNAIIRYRKVNHGC
jgi:hypothetical protein